MTNLAWLSLAMSWLIGTPLSSQAQGPQSYEFEKESKKSQLCRYPGEWTPEKYKVYLGYTVRDSKRNAYYNVVQWRGPRGRVITFVGLESSDGAGWWFGELNGKPAAGYNLNRNHHVFSTADTQMEFECWDEGWNEHEEL